ncbi:MAG: hypothetical protein V3T70_05610, partial [Phycisphaerae bacterium]
MSTVRRARWGLLAGFCLLAMVSRSAAWDENGHVMVTELAVAGLPSDFPAWLKDAPNTRRLAYLSAEPDRWRGTHLPAMTHWNNPDHYLDVEFLEPYGLSLKTLPRLRYEYVGRLAAYRALHPDAFGPAKADDDPNLVRITPGMLPYRVMELYARIRSGWSTLRTFEKYADTAESWRIEAARTRIVQAMGLLSHYIGDAAQPLHTTKHFNGWAGDNPNDYTTQ